MTLAINIYLQACTKYKQKVHTLAFVLDPLTYEQGAGRATLDAIGAAIETVLKSSLRTP